MMSTCGVHSTLAAGPRPEPGAVLPLSPAAAAVCRESLAALRHPGRTPLAGNLGQALALLEDPAFLQAAAELRELRLRQIRGEAVLEAEILARRRSLFQELRERHPEASAALARALGGTPPAPRRDPNFIVVSTYTVLVVFTVGAGAREENPFAEPARID
jgi:hypothetical protein